MTDRMGDVNHTHRNDPRNVFAEMFRRGASTTADGGREETDSTMAEVEHEPTDGTDANDVWVRGETRGTPEQ